MIILPNSYLNGIHNSVAEFSDITVWENGKPDLSSAKHIYEIFQEMGDFRLIICANVGIPHKIAPGSWVLC